MAARILTGSLPTLLQRRADKMAAKLLQPASVPMVDFARPPGEPALVDFDSVSWRIFKNPVSLFIGGVAAVILELAEPAVRTGVWERSSFRINPMRRLQRTGLAAMVTVYGPRSRAEAMITDIAQVHGKVTGVTPGGERYCADDVGLLTWVQATASFGFAHAYSHYVDRLNPEAFNMFYKEAIGAAHLYGALDAPTSESELRALFDSKRDRLEPSPVVFEFLTIMREAHALPAALRPIQRMLVRAAVELTPGWVRERLGLSARYGLRLCEAALVKQMASASDKLMLPSSPAVQSCLRLGLPADYLYGR